MTDLAFSAIPVGALTAKPRRQGLTMMIDLGIPLTLQQDLLRMAGEYIDLAKIAIGTSRLLPEAYLREKLNAYVGAGVDPFPGGMFLEYACARGLADAYLRQSRAVGFPAVEVSDNYIRFSPGQKAALIRRAIDDYGLRVLAEVGRKVGVTDLEALVRGITDALDAGASAVLVEAAELYAGDRQGSLVQALAGAVPLERLIFELPGRWIPGTGFADVPALMLWLVGTVGSEVNVANVLPDDVLLLQNTRVGLGSNLDLAGAGEKTS